MTMIDRVARAMYLHQVNPDQGEAVLAVSVASWGDLPDEPRHGAQMWLSKAFWRNAARAAIETMREPTARMLPDEGVHIGFFHDADGIEDNLYADKDEARDIWKAMIDAALSETDA